ncbi:hypothetical protein COO60DRAFT_88876 [Scenedesmus sp. NREL 46B-D3]|nr:hypothetical protein COO60DRAFT_88876 [Scenedesmus sp. NREL 46B-D3]
MFEVDGDATAAAAAARQHTSAAAAAGSSSSGGSSRSGPLHSRTPSKGRTDGLPAAYPSAAFPLSMPAVQPHTPGTCGAAAAAAAAAAAGAMAADSSSAGGPAALSSSPQLPFAFTPSAASLGMSLISLADQHRNFLGGTSLGSGLGTTPGGGRGGAAPRHAAAGGAAPRSPLAPPAAAAAGNAPCSGSGIGAAATAAAAAAGQAIPGSSVGGASSQGGIGTPSPPPHPAHPQHPVSCVRDISGLATIRRPSWSSRSSSFDVAASASLPHHLSMSPMMGDLLDPVLLGCSSSNGSHGGGMAQHLGPAAAAAAAAGRGIMAGGRGRGAGVLMTPAVVLPGGFGPSQQEEGQAAAAAAAAGTVQCGCESPARALAACAAGPAAAAVGGDAAATAVGADGGAAPSGCTSAGADVHDLQRLLSSALPDESESDILPFAIDSEACGSHAACFGSNAGAASAAGPNAAGNSRAVRGSSHSQQQQQGLGWKAWQQQQRSSSRSSSSCWWGMPCSRCSSWQRSCRRLSSPAVGDHRSRWPQVCSSSRRPGCGRSPLRQFLRAQDCSGASPDAATAVAAGVFGSIPGVLLCAAVLWVSLGCCHCIIGSDFEE